MEMIDKIKKWFKKRECEKLLLETTECFVDTVRDRHKDQNLQVEKLFSHKQFAEYIVKSPDYAFLHVRVNIYINDDYSGITIKSLYFSDYPLDIVEYIIDKYSYHKKSFMCKDYKYNKYIVLADIMETLMDITNLEFLRIMLNLECITRWERAKNDESAEEVQNV